MSNFIRQNTTKPFSFWIKKLTKLVKELTALAEAFRWLLWKLLKICLLAKVISVVVTGRATFAFSEQLLGWLSR